MGNLLHPPDQMEGPVAATGPQDPLDAFSPERNSEEELRAGVVHSSAKSPAWVE